MLDRSSRISLALCAACSRHLFRRGSSLASDLEYDLLSCQQKGYGVTTEELDKLIKIFIYTNRFD